MTDEKTNEEIKQLEIRIKEKIKIHGESTQARALDQEYMSMLNQLKEAYSARDGPKTLDELGLNRPDRERAKCLAGILKKLQEEVEYLKDEFLRDPYR